MKHVLIILIVLNLAGCKITDEDGNTVTTTESTTETETVIEDKDPKKDKKPAENEAKPRDLAKYKCGESWLLGTWSMWTKSYSEKYYIIFREDCSLTIPNCGGTYKLNKNTKQTGVIKFKVKTPPKNEACFAKGAHSCDFGVYADSLYLTCDEEPSFTYTLEEL